MGCKGRCWSRTETRAQRQHCNYLSHESVSPFCVKKLWQPQLPLFEKDSLGRQHENLQLRIHRRRRIDSRDSLANHDCVFLPLDRLYVLGFTVQENTDIGCRYTILIGWLQW